MKFSAKLDVAMKANTVKLLNQMRGTDFTDTTETVATIADALDRAFLSGSLFAIEDNMETISNYEPTR
jgi:hypothetical protein